MEKNGKRAPISHVDSDETNLFSEILAYPVNNFMETLKKGRSKKREVFDSIVVEFKEGLEKAQFKEKDSKNFKAKKKETKLVVEVKPLQIKYNNLKQQWRKITDKKKPALDYPSLKTLNGSKSSINDDDVEQETPPDKTRLKTKIVTKPNEK